MADLHIVREHTLGLTKARKIAFQWAEQVETDFSMRCSYTEGPTRDEVEFVRPGVKGCLHVTPTQFELQAELGFLVGVFKHTIEAEIVKNLDTLLAVPAAPAKKRAAQKTG